MTLFFRAEGWRRLLNLSSLFSQRIMNFILSQDIGLILPSCIVLVHEDFVYAFSNFLFFLLAKFLKVLHLNLNFSLYVPHRKIRIFVRNLVRYTRLKNPTVIRIHVKGIFIHFFGLWSRCYCKTFS